MPFFIHGLIGAMCGIGGIILNSSASQEARRLAVRQTQAMLEQLKHRGPDAQQAVSLNDDCVHLAHSRLAIIELSEAGSQPMTSRCGRYCLVFNGEIYNHQELREQLSHANITLESASDTEALLYWLITHKQHGLNQLRGMFSLFFWDSQTHTAIAARDPLGIKPLYFHHDRARQSLSFASEVRALRETLEDDQYASAAGVQGFLRLGSFQEPHTIIAGVQELPAGHFLLWGNGTKTVQRFWHPNNKQNKLQSTGQSQPNKIKADKNLDVMTSRPASVAHLRKALEDTIAAHFVSDVPVGIFLSGGIDSTALLALATQYYKNSSNSSPNNSTNNNQPIHTFSIAFEDPAWNEGDLAQRTALHFGSQHTQWVITKREAQALFDDYLKAIDQPSIDGFNTFCVSKLAHDNGYKVVLSGVGGDELFAGYGSFKSVPRLRTLAKIGSVAWPLSYLIRHFFWHILPAKLRRLSDIAVSPFKHSAAYFGFRGIFSAQEATALQTSLGLPSVRDPLPSHASPILNNYELEFYLRNQLLRDSDCMSMAWGLELRVPLVDSFFYEQLLQIPEKWRLEQGKKLLVDAVPELPQWVIEQPKRGFRFPFDEWLSDEWSNLEQGYTWPNNVASTPWYRRWALISLLNSFSRLRVTSPLPTSAKNVPPHE